MRREHLSRAILRETRGPRCVRRDSSSLVLTRTVVTRGLILLEPDESGVLQAVRVQADIALARCRGCKGRFRVLPSNVLARKAYSVEVIEHALASYAAGHKGLRDVVWSILGDRTPAHTTLHAWSEGLGAHVLGLPLGEVPGGSPVSRLLVQTQSRVRAIEPLLLHDFPVNPFRARSPERRERLSANKRILALAEAATDVPAPGTLTRWRQLALRWSNTCALLFRTGIACTAIGRCTRRSRQRSRSPPQRSLDP